MKKTEQNEKNRELMELVLRNFAVPDWYYGMRRLLTDRAEDTLRDFMDALFELSEEFSGCKINDVAEWFASAYDEVEDEMYGDDDEDEEEEE